MITKGHILVINPGSTSTKIAAFHVNTRSGHLELTRQANLTHTDLSQNQKDELKGRLADVRTFLSKGSEQFQLIMARGAPLRPLKGGAYAVNDAMLADLRSQRYSSHASNLAAIMGAVLADELGVSVFITDPITTDELRPEARVSGVPGYERKSRSHALNIKASVRKVCNQIDKVPQQSQWVVCHLGGGISIAAVKHDQIIDVNDALLGMGPFSPERAGALPTAVILDLVFKDGLQRSELEHLFSRESGLKGYLGTADLTQVEAMINAGDSNALLVFQAMVYQIIKEVSAMASVLKFDLDGIILTGGMAHSRLLTESLVDGIQGLGQVFVEAGENEMEALATAGLHILSGETTVLTYTRAKKD